MTLQDDLRMYAEDIHACYGHNDYSTTMSLAADRIDELEATIRKMAMDSLSVEGQWSDEVDELEKQVARLKTVPMKYRRMEFNAQLQKELEAKQARIDELMMEHCPNEMTAEQMQNWEAHQVRESANQMLNGWKEDQECRNASS